MAEVHIIGELRGGSGFPNNALFCKFAFVCGGAWHLLEGHAAGQTQVDTPADGRAAKWGHPIGMFVRGEGKGEGEGEGGKKIGVVAALWSLSFARLVRHVQQLQPTSTLC